MTPDQIRDIRATLAMSQVALAEYLGVTRTAVQNWENARYEISVPTQILLKLMALKGRAWVDKTWRQIQ